MLRTKVAGAVAPACPAASNKTGIPPRTPASKQALASSANFKGGTTKQHDILTKGRSRQAVSLPEIKCNICIDSLTVSGKEKLVPTCFCVPEIEA